ncbi:hypothetical protein SAMN05216266_1108 [Amycolatopsis marina]|uniref:Zinc-finger n=1 Tax=Amycolatopsis marina TaxID=490629 RepID=A0A1I1ANS6_9PSEU|nr:hypothetical protein [Amycolatopsis marina]SFB39671.1 hypothetical protein SAMN05216266_1108 [Amycolatopsis marina]
MSPRTKPRWETASQRRHIIREHRVVDGVGWVLTGCGSLAEQSRYDLRMVDPPTCPVCRMLHPST